MNDITTSSNRLYIDENEQIRSVVSEIKNTIKQFNRHLYHTYNLLIYLNERRIMYGKRKIYF